MELERKSHCKVNFLLNVLGKRPDGFHELETVMHPVNWCDHIRFVRAGDDLRLTCSRPDLAVDSTNLVHRAAVAFFQAARIHPGVQIHLVKNIPLAAGLGGGSGNAAATLLGLNELFGAPLRTEQLANLAATLGSDVPFFLQTQPALATGRGERIEPLDFFPALRDVSILLIHPGFGIPTAWAYQHLSRFPAALNGAPGRARQLISWLRAGDLPRAGAAFYNSLESPALRKFPLLALFQEFLRAHGAEASLMSGSGSTTFALARDPAAAEQLALKLKSKFGEACWTAVAAL